MFEMGFDKRKSGITLLEILIAIAIAASLGAVLLSATQSILPKAEAAKCMNNLKTLRTAFSSYVDDGWPQLPPGIALGSIKEQEWWLEKTKKDLQLSEKDWLCPTLSRMLKGLPKSQRPRIHYLPTPFSGEPNKANTWPEMPWFIEIGNAHGGGNFLIRMKGDAEQAAQ